MIVGILLVLAAIANFYRHISWKLSYWRRQGIPGPKPRFYYGHSRELHQLDYPGVFQLRKWTQEYGPVYGVYEGTNRVLIMSNIVDIHEFCTKKADCFEARKLLHLASDEDGEDDRCHMAEVSGWRWRRLRATASTLFTTISLEKVTPTIEDSTLHLMSRLYDRSLNEESFNIHEYFQEYTFDVISRLVVGQRESRLFDNPLCDQLRGIFVRDLNLWYLDLNLAFPSLSPFLRRLFNALSVRFENPIGMTLSEMEKVVNARIKAKELGDIEESDDFIDAFLNVQTEDFDGKRIRSLSREEIIAQCFLFVMAGFDTTASALSFTAYTLATHEDVQKRVQEEIDRVFGKDAIRDWSKLNDLPYLESVIKETLRLYPLAASGTGRRCTRTTVIGGVTVEKGTYVQPDVCTIHHDRTIWGEDVEEFRPERWLDQFTSAQLNRSFLSFGLGPRKCIGVRLSQLEMKMVLVNLLGTYDIVPTSQTESDLSYLGSTTFSPKSVTIRLQSRNSLVHS